MQSGYSELMGLYPPGLSGAKQLSQANIDSLSSKAAPAFKVKNVDTINSALGFSALPNEYTSVPITVFANKDILNDADFNGCPYLVQNWDTRQYDRVVFKDYEYMKGDVRTPLAESLDIGKLRTHVDYYDFYHLTDAAVAEQFEGVWAWEDYYTADQWLTTNEFQKVFLTLAFSVEGNDLISSRMMRDPLHIMKRRVASMLGIEEASPADDWFNGFEDSMKYFIYSAHDTQVDNMMIWLKPTNVEANFYPYAS